MFGSKQNKTKRTGNIYLPALGDRVLNVLHFRLICPFCPSSRGGFIRLTGHTGGFADSASVLCHSPNLGVLDRTGLFFLFFFFF